MYHKFYHYLLIKLLLYQFSLSFIFCENITTDHQASGQIKSSNESAFDFNCRNLFLAISLGSLFIYLASVSIGNCLLRDCLPEVYSNKSKHSKVLSKYLVKLMFGKWSSNFEFNDTFLNFEFNAHDPKLVSSSFILPLHWLKKFMDHLGTKEHPHLKAIKFWAYQPDSLGIISSVKLGIKDSKNLNTCIYIDSIELSKIDEDNIQVINIQKNVSFLSLNQQSLNFDLDLRQNATLKPFYEGYSPYFIFSDYFYFYIIYLNLSFLILNYVSFDWIFDSELNAPNTFSFKKIIISSLIRSSICSIFIILAATFYLGAIRSRLAIRQNSEVMQTLNILFLVSLFFFLFVINYLVSEDQTNRYRAEKFCFLIELIILQILYAITFLCLWFLNSIFKSRTMNNMTFKMTNFEKIKSTEKPDSTMSKQSEKLKTLSSSSVGSKRLSTDSRTTHPKSNKLNKQFTKFVRIATIPAVKEEHPLKRIDSDNSIGSGYYQQMITATKHVRSISQYGELLKDKN